MNEVIPGGAHWIKVNRFFGDGMMIFSAIEPLRRAGLPLVFWGPAAAVDLFQGSAGVVGTLAEPQRRYSAFQAAKSLRAHRPASLVAFPKSARPLLAGWLARVPLRLGCGDGGVSLLCTHSVAFYKQDGHFVDRYASVVHRAFPELGPMGFTAFRPRAEAFQRREDQARSVGLSGEYLVLAPGANSASKRPPVALLVALGRRAEAAGLSVVILGAGEEDRKLGELISAELPHAFNLVDQCSLSLSAAWICQGRALLGGDSGLAHIAGGAGMPTLVLFGPTRPRHSMPRGPRVKVLRKEDLGCLECMVFNCPLPDHPCMAALPDRLVWDELLALMETP
jgi:ADP-heptose:LPS heptosyltransferase